MKISVLFFLLFFLNFSTVSAVGDVIVMPPDNQSDNEKSADKEFISVRNASSFAFYSTDDYYNIIQNDLAMVAVQRFDDYKKVLANLSSLVSSTNDSYAKYCASFAEAILIERVATLDAYINFAKCYSAKDSDGCRAFNSQIEYRGNRAAKLRKDFFDLYGF